MHALKTLYFAGVVLDARGRWSCAHRQLPIRPQINRHGRPPKEGSTAAAPQGLENWEGCPPPKKNVQPPPHLGA